MHREQIQRGGPFPVAKQLVKVHPETTIKGNQTSKV